MLEDCYACSLDPFGGKAAQNFDIGLSFNMIASRRGDFQNITIKSQKLPVFCS